MKTRQINIGLLAFMFMCSSTIFGLSLELKLTNGVFVSLGLMVIVVFLALVSVTKKPSKA